MAHECNVCGMPFVNKSELIIHMHVHRGTTPHTCTVCEKPFSSRHNRDRHMLSHSGVKDYSCDMCDKAFSTKGNLLTHHRIHTGEKPWLCAVCDRAFGNKIDLTYHTRTHTGEMPHSCHVCHKAFRVKSNLTRHMRVHTGERPHRCEVCDMSFSEKGNLARHTRVHFMFTKKRPPRTDAEMPYKCDVCLTSFSKRGNLTRHLLIHSPEKPYNCEICSKGYIEKKSLERHLLVHTGKGRHSKEGQLVDDGQLADDGQHNEEGQLADEEQLPGDVTHDSGSKLAMQINDHLNGDYCNGKRDIAALDVSGIVDDTSNNTCNYHMNKLDSDSLHVSKNTVAMEYINNMYSKRRPNLAMMATLGSPAGSNVNVYEQDKRHACFACDQSYSDERILAMHMRLHEYPGDQGSGQLTVKSEEIQPTCHICGESFPDDTLLAIHVNKHVDGGLTEPANVFKEYFTESTSLEGANTKTDENQYTCNICEHSFSDELLLAIHMNIHTEGRGSNSDRIQATSRGVYQGSRPDGNISELVTVKTENNLDTCEICYKSFADESALATHMDVHAGGGNAESCNVINGSYSENTGPEHATIKTEGAKQFCDVCEQSFSNKTLLAIHMHLHKSGGITDSSSAKATSPDVYPGSHSDNSMSELETVKTENNPYTCGICYKSFAEEITLATHVDVHAGGGNAESCNVIHGSFSENTGSEHVTIKPEGAKVFCDLCDQSFSDGTLLAIHTRVHTSGGITDSSSATASSPDMYIGTHSDNSMSEIETFKTENNPYTCGICYKSFADEITLATHVDVHAGGGNAESCNVIHGAFSENTGSEHVTIKPEGAKVFCDLCDQSFSDRTLLAIHTRVHTSGGITDSSSATASSPDVYIGTHSDNSMSETETVKTENNPYTCGICYKYFADESALATHIDVHAGGGNPESGKVIHGPFSENTGSEHVTIKTEGVKVFCDLCEQSFSDGTLLAIHMRVHTSGWTADSYI